MDLGCGNGLLVHILSSEGVRPGLGPFPEFSLEGLCISVRAAEFSVGASGARTPSEWWLRQLLLLRGRRPPPRDGGGAACRWPRMGVVSATCVGASGTMGLSGPRVCCWVFPLAIAPFQGMGREEQEGGLCPGRASVLGQSSAKCPHMAVGSDH